MISQSHKSLDRWGIVLSSACVVHCIGLPLLFSLPVFGMAVFESHWFHAIISLIIVPLASIAFARGYRHHRRKWILIVGGTGLLLIIVSVFVDLGSHQECAHEFAGRLLSIFAGLLLVIAHTANLNLCRRCSHSHS